MGLFTGIDGRLKSSSGGVVIDADSRPYNNHNNHSVPFQDNNPVSYFLALVSGLILFVFGISIAFQMFPNVYVFGFLGVILSPYIIFALYFVLKPFLRPFLKLGSKLCSFFKRLSIAYMHPVWLALKWIMFVLKHSLINMFIVSLVSFGVYLLYLIVGVPTAAVLGLLFAFLTIKNLRPRIIRAFKAHIKSCDALIAASAKYRERNFLDLFKASIE